MKWRVGEVEGGWSGGWMEWRVGGVWMEWRVGEVEGGCSGGWMKWRVDGVEGG